MGRPVGVGLGRGPPALLGRLSAHVGGTFEGFWGGWGSGGNQIRVWPGERFWWESLCTWLTGEMLRFCKASFISPTPPTKRENKTQAPCNAVTKTKESQNQPLSPTHPRLACWLPFLSACRQITAHLGVYYALNKNGIQIFSVYKAEVSGGKRDSPFLLVEEKEAFGGGLGPPMAGGGENRFLDTLDPAPRVLCQPQPPNPRALPTPLRALPGGGFRGFWAPGRACVCAHTLTRVSAHARLRYPSRCLHPLWGGGSRHRPLSVPLLARSAHLPQPRTCAQAALDPCLPCTDPAGWPWAD